MKHKIPLLKISITNKNDEEAVIDIDGEIGWVTYDGEEVIWNTKEAIKRQLKEISAIKAKKIIVNISSLGGFIDDGLAIHDLLASHSAEVETRVNSLTASAATIIAQAGDVRKISDNSLYLVHKAFGIGFGNSNDMKVALDDLIKIDNKIANIYAKRSGKDIADFEELMNENNGDGKWIDAEEAEELGLVDEVFEPMKAAAAVVDRGAFDLMGLPEPKGYEFVKTDSKASTNLKNEPKEISLKLDSKEFFDNLEKQLNKKSKSKKMQKIVPLSNLANKRRVTNNLKLLK